MQNKFNTNQYFKSLTKTNMSLDKLIDIEKILRLIKEQEMNLNALNYLITRDKNDFQNRVRKLYIKNKSAFESIYVLAALRKNNKKYFLIKNKELFLDQYLITVEDYLYFFEQSGLMQLILNSNIKNFIDYCYGIEVGLDSHSRKNRCGAKQEKFLYTKIMTMLNKRKDLKIYSEKYLDKLPDEIRTKRIDIVIENTNTNKTLLIESSFYNSNGSKISETAKAYKNITNTLKQEKLDKNYYFVWIADGNGMKSIRSFFENNKDNSYVYSKKMFFENFDNLIAKISK